MELVIKLTGAIQSSNFDAYKAEILETIAGINTDLKTDEDFARAEQDIKKCAEAEKAIAAAKEEALNQTKPIRDLFAGMNEIAEKLSGTRIPLDKQVKSKKIELKDKTISDGIKSLEKMIDLEAKGMDTGGIFTINRELFALAVKGKKTLSSMEEAVSIEAVNQFERFQKINDLVVKNLEMLAPIKKENPSLFYDENKLVMMETEAMMMVVNGRVDKFKAEQVAAELAKKAAAEANEREAEKPKENASVNVEPEKAPAVEQHTEIAAADRFAINIELSCPKEKAISIAQDLEEYLKKYDEALTSINLARR